MATLPEVEPVKAVPVSSLDELHTGDHILYQDTDSRDGYRSALVTSEPEDGCLRVITIHNMMWGVREETLQFSSLPHLHKVQYSPCQYSGEEAVLRARSRELLYNGSHELVSLAKTGVKHSLRTIIEELKAECGEPVRAVRVSSLDKLHTGDHILYQDTDSRDGYHSALVRSSKPAAGGVRFEVITGDIMWGVSEETLQLSSLPHLHKVLYTPCLYSGEEAVQRARSGGPRYSDSHGLVSWAKTGVKHSLSTIIGELIRKYGPLHTGERDPFCEPDRGYDSVIQDPMPIHFVQLSDEELSNEGEHQLSEALSLPDTASCQQPQSDEELSDEIEAISPPDTDDCPTAVPIAPIRGCTIVAERNFPITQSAEVFNWPEYGITISAPKNSIPEKLADTQSILLNVRVSLSGLFQLGASKLMSAVYWLCPNIRCKFAKPLELTVEHCAHLKHPDDHTKLTFLRTQCNQKDLPYKFEEIEGKFMVQSGTVALRSFSGVAIGSKAAESAPPPMKYVGRLVTQKTHVTEWKALYAVFKDLQSSWAFDRERKVASGPFTATTYTELMIRYQENTISLDLPVKGVTVEDGNWKILPLGPPRLFIADGESYEPFRDFPECSLALEWISSGTPSTTLHHIVKIRGTVDIEDCIVLHVNPTRLQQAEHCQQQASTLSTQPQQSKHRAIEGLLPDLAAVICGKSDPEVFADHLAAKRFLSSQVKSNITGTKEKTPHSTVSRLLDAVVVTIKSASSPEESEKHFENFVTIIRKLELNDLAQRLTNRCAELEDAAALSVEASAHFTTAPARIQDNTAPQMNPLSPTGSPQKRIIASAPADTTAVDNSPVPQAQPTKPKVSDALKMLLPLRDDWQTIGALLEVEEEKLSAIQHKQKDVSKNCLRVILDEWLKSTAPPPSWQALADAVESIDSDTADKIQRDYIH